jgi:hypothetical protein
MSPDAGASASQRWAPWAVAAGGALMIVLWIVFTASHGPTSVNEGHLIVGRDMHFWGLLLGIVPNALIAAGLVGLREPLLRGSRRVGVVGYALALGGLIASALLDLAFGALGPPLLMPVVGVGLVLLGLGGDDSRERWVRGPMMIAIGALLLVAFVVALVPLEISDAVDGYRVFGVVGYLLPGVGWLAIGVAAVRRTARRSVIA